MQTPQVILLKEGTDTSQGKPHLISNINACTAVGDVVRTTLGPRGMDKLIHDDKVCVSSAELASTAGPRTNPRLHRRRLWSSCNMCSSVHGRSAHPQHAHKSSLTL